ncbi:MAG: hypothetical protein ACSLE4_05270, partial [Methyloceanibacter sp.]|uniref:hypothetical protein n=1 Tax=Methyloceanibacter sp. TaxID=1965321 RepID=UPI003EE2F42F
MRAFTPTFGVLSGSLGLALLVALPVVPVSQVLEIASDSLTAYKYASNTIVQGVRPQVLQRGVTIDGAMRS